MDRKVDPKAALAMTSSRPASPAQEGPVAADAVQPAAGTRTAEMPHGAQHVRGVEADLDRTDELPILDITSYEVTVAEAVASPVTLAPDEPGAALEEGRPSAVVGLSPSDTLRDIEAWIAAQNARDLANQQALAALRESQAEAWARTESLATELDGVRGALQAALTRANDGERALHDSQAAVHAAERRTAELATELEKARAEVSAQAQRLTDQRAELEAERQSLASNARAQAELERGHAERAQSLAERAQHHAEARSQAYLEKLRSREWQRGVWEGVWRELDAELDVARTSLARLEQERAELAGTVETLRTELAARGATIERLEADCAAGTTALAELAGARSVDERAHDAAMHELSARNASLVTEAGALVEARRQLTESLAARDAELAEARSGQAALESALQAAQAVNTAQVARLAELEGVTINLSQALQVQTAAVQRVTDLLATVEREKASHEARIADLEAELKLAVQAVAEQRAATQAAEATVGQHAQQLAASRERLAALEQDTRAQVVRIETLEAELAAATSLAEQTDAPRRALESELEQLKEEHARQCDRAVVLEAQHRELALELERTRGALEERELQMRRLQRQATASAQALGRIKVGIGRAAPSAERESEYLAGHSAALVPVEGDGDPIRLRKGRTTIGRAPTNDICLRETSVSRHHAAVVLGANGVFVEDQGSVNGVSVNGHRVRFARLAEGDVVTLGLLRFRFTTGVEGQSEAG
jgi:chromosome segregation ATPase